MVSLKRKDPKLNTIYPITKDDSITSIDCRINFAIIDLMYVNCLKKNNKKRMDYDYKLYEFLSIGESYYEKLRNGSKIDMIKDDKNYPYVKINNLINGSCKLEIIGVSRKQWKQYFRIIKKIKRLKEDKEDNKYIEEATRRKKNFRRMILEKINNQEMSQEAIDIYKKMEIFLFKDSLLEQSKKKADKYLGILKKLTMSDLETLYKADKEKYQELHNMFDLYVKKMNDVKRNNH